MNPWIITREEIRSMSALFSCARMRYDRYMSRRIRFPEGGFPSKPPTTPARRENDGSTRRNVLRLLAGGAVVAAGAKAVESGAVDAVLNAIKPHPGEREEAEATAPPGRAPRHLAESSEFEPSGHRYSSENNAFGAAVRHAKGSRDLHERFAAVRRFGLDAQCGLEYGIGTCPPALFVRRHIRSAARTQGFPRDLLPRLPSLAPALIGVESGFNNSVVNASSGASGAVQFMPRQWEAISRRLGRTLDPKNLEDLTAFLGAYLADSREHLMREMGAPNRSGIALNNIKRLVFSVVEDDTTPENLERLATFEKEFLLFADMNSYNCGVPNLSAALLWFEMHYLHDHVEELRGMAGNGRAVYGKFLSVMREKANAAIEAERVAAEREGRPKRRLSHNGFGPEQIEYVPMVCAMAELIDHELPAR